MGRPHPRREGNRRTGDPEDDSEVEEEDDQREEIAVAEEESGDYEEEMDQEPTDEDVYEEDGTDGAEPASRYAEVGGVDQFDGWDGDAVFPLSVPTGRRFA